MQPPLLQQFTTQAVNNARERELLDKAIIGMAAMIDLVERHRAAQPNLMTTDPEAITAESLDLVKAMEGAAKQERRRIVAYLRDQAKFYGPDNLDESSTERTLLDVAMAIEIGLSSSS